MKSGWFFLALFAIDVVICLYVLKFGVLPIVALVGR